MTTADSDDPSSVTPDPSVHNLPPDDSGSSTSLPPAVLTQSQAWGQTLLNEVGSAIVMALMNVVTDVEKPFEALSTFGEEVLDGSALGTSAAADWTAFLEGIGIPDADVTAFISWWIGLLGWLSGTSTTPALTGTTTAPSVTNTPTQAQPFSNFPDAASIQAGGGWSYDGTTSYSGSGGSVEFTCSSAGIGTMRGVVATVQPDQVVTLSAQLQWSGLTYTGSDPIQLQIIPWNGSTPGTPVEVVQIASPGTSASWTLLTGNYTVPASGVTAVQIRLVVQNATAGSVWWAACTTTISGGYLPNIEAGVVALQQESAAATAATQTFLQAIQTAVTNDAGNWPQLISDLQAAYQTWSTAESQLAADEIATLQQMFDAIFGIDPNTGLTLAGSVQAIGGAGSTLVDTLNAWASQFGAALSGDVADAGDLAGLAQLIALLDGKATQANTTALSTAAVQAIVNNQPVAAGLEATVESNGDFHQATPLTSATVTKTTSRGALLTVSQAKTLSFQQWMGEYTAAITGFVLNFYQMDSSGNLVWLFTTPNLGASVPASATWVLYDLLTANDIAVSAGDIIGVEWQIITSGTIEPLGFTAPTTDSHPSAAIKQLGFTQNWAGAAATTIPAASIGWSQYAPYVGLGVGSPPPTPFFPQTFSFTVGGGTHTPDAWVNFVDLVGVGGGGGGSGYAALNGAGGLGGTWNFATLTVGVTNPTTPGMDIPTGGTIDVSNAPPGAGSPYFTAGSPGTALTFSWVDMAGAAQTLTCPGGLGGDAADNPSSFGESPGNITYLGTPYIGGVQTAYGQGNPPGGGGSGGYFGQNGGAGIIGAYGQAWIVDRQS